MHSASLKTGFGVSLLLLVAATAACGERPTAVTPTSANAPPVGASPEVAPDAPGGSKLDPKDIAATTAALEELPGFALLPKEQRAALGRLFQQPTNAYSRAVRRDFVTYLEKLRAAPPEDQAKGLVQIALTETDLSKPPVDGLFAGAWPKYAQVMVATVPATNAYTIGKPTIGRSTGVQKAKDDAKLTAKLASVLQGKNDAGAIAKDDFDAAVEKSALFPVTINGQTIVVSAPLTKDRKAPEPSAVGSYPADATSKGPMMNHSVEDTAKALAQLPDMNRKLLTGEVVITATRSPLDGIFATLQGRQDMRAVMAASIFPIGSIGVFAQPEAQTGPIQLDSMVHETGHTWTYKTWGVDPTSKGWTAWRAAIAADGIYPSWYASVAFIEDAAESVLMYVAARSTGDAGAALRAELEALYPNRWAILAKELPGS